MQRLARKVSQRTCSFFYRGTEHDSFKAAITRRLVRDVVFTIAIQETHFGLFIFNFNENSSDILCCYSTSLLVLISPTEIGVSIIWWDKLFHSLLKRTPPQYHI
jgi:hypothetical protein